MDISRRTLIGGAALLTASAAMPGRRRAMASGRKTLRLATRQIEVDGRPATRYGVVQADGAFGLTRDEGDMFDVRLENGLDVPSGLHWHGMVEPWRQDGVPYLSGPPIEPGGQADYRFPAKPTGTRWMHSHFGLQEQNLLAAPLIIREASAIRSGAQEVVILLEDFSWTKPEEILANLRKPAPMAMPASGGNAQAGGVAAVGGMARMAMSDADLNDVDYDAFLANDRTLDDPEVFDVERGGEVRLRIINAAASSNFTIDLGTLEATLLSVDGSPVAPMTVSRFPIAIAQRVDLLLRMPSDGSAVPVLAHAEGRRLRAGVILKPPGATVAKVPVEGGADGPRVTLADEMKLRAAEPLPDRSVDRRIPVELTGTMNGYFWLMPVHGMVGLPAQAERGERVEITFRNTTMMSHPMHLHGHVFQVVEVDGTRFAGAIRDTVLVTPGKTVTIAFDADNPGIWAFHCHNLYHMAAGMFSTLVYRGFD